MSTETTFGTIAGIPIIVVLDDDERVRDLPPETAAVRGGSLYVGESLWPVLRDALRAQAAKNAEERT